ncbi:MAG: DnaJ domain-containing protein [Bryobacteraceae bacterium]
MSAPLAGRFQDYYQVLDVHAEASAEAIQRAYSRLAAKFHPDNKESGDAARFKAVQDAYEVLRDPLSRADFDTIRSGPPPDVLSWFSGASFFEAITNDVARRQCILCVLYDRRRKRPTSPGLSMRMVESMISGTPDEIFIAVWYLKQRRLAQNDEKSNLMITVDGMEFIERNPPPAELIQSMVKPEKPEANAEVEQESAIPEPPAAESSSPDAAGPQPLANLLTAVSDEPPLPTAERRPEERLPEERKIRVGNQTITLYRRQQG